MQLRLHGAGRASEHLGDLGDRQILDVEQCDHLCLRRGQLSQTCKELTVVDTDLDIDCWAVPEASERHRFPPEFAPTIDRPIRDDPTDESERVVVGSDAVPMSVCVGECILRQFFGHPAVAGQAVGEAENPTVAALVNDAEVLDDAHVTGDVHRRTVDRTRLGVHDYSDTAAFPLVTAARRICRGALTQRLPWHATKLPRRHA